jgi:hypothetical protein
MITITKLAGHKAVVSCLPGVIGLHSASLRPSTVQGFRKLSSTGLSGAAEAHLLEHGVVAVNERPTKAPAAVPAAQVSAYALAAKGADLRQKWTDGFASGAPSATEHPTMRAFRGPKPWRDPA